MILKEKPQLLKCKNAGNSGRSVNWLSTSTPAKDNDRVKNQEKNKQTTQHNDCISKRAHPPLHLCHSNSPAASIPAH